MGRSVISVSILKTENWPNCFGFEFHQLTTELNRSNFIRLVGWFGSGSVFAHPYLMVRWFSGNLQVSFLGWNTSCCKGILGRGCRRGKTVSSTNKQLLSLLICNSMFTNSFCRRAFRDELSLLQKIRHPNVVQFLGAVTQSSPMMIVTEYLPRVAINFAGLYLNVFIWSIPLHV